MDGGPATVGVIPSVSAPIRLCITGKQPRHGIDDASFLQPDRTMSAIGG